MASDATFTQADTVNEYVEEKTFSKEEHIFILNQHSSWYFKVSLVTECHNVDTSCEG